MSYPVGWPGTYWLEEEVNDPITLPDLSEKDKLLEDIRVAEQEFFRFSRENKDVEELQTAKYRYFIKISRPQALLRAKAWKSGDMKSQRYAKKGNVGRIS